MDREAVDEKNGENSSSDPMQRNNGLIPPEAGLYRGRGVPVFQDVPALTDGGIVTGGSIFSNAFIAALATGQPGGTVIDPDIYSDGCAVDGGSVILESGGTIAKAIVANGAITINGRVVGEVSGYLSDITIGKTGTAGEVALNGGHLDPPSHAVIDGRVENSVFIDGGATAFVNDGAVVGGTVTVMGTCVVSLSGSANSIIADGTSIVTIASGGSVASALIGRACMDPWTHEPVGGTLLVSRGGFVDDVTVDGLSGYFSVGEGVHVSSAAVLNGARAVLSRDVLVSSLVISFFQFL